MLHHVHILFFTLAVLAILALSDRGAATSLQTSTIVITNGCYTIGIQKICPNEIKGYMPVPEGLDDVFIIDPFGTITGPGQQSQQQQVQQGETDKEDPQQQQQQQQQQPPSQSGGGIIVD